MTSIRVNLTKSPSLSFVYNIRSKELSCVFTNMGEACNNSFDRTFYTTVRGQWSMTGEKSLFKAAFDMVCSPPSAIYKKWQSCNSAIKLFEVRKKFYRRMKKQRVATPATRSIYCSTEKGKTQQGLQSETTQKRFKTPDSCLLACHHSTCKPSGSTFQQVS